MVIYLFQKHPNLSMTVPKPCGLSYLVEHAWVAVGGEDNDC